MLLLLVLALSHKILALDPSCYIPKLVPRIVGGTATNIREFPFLAEVRTASTLCGGSLIAPTWVLTAAHCGQSEYVVMGKYNLDGDDPCEERINVKRRVPHPLYNAAAHTNDLMLLELESPSTYQPIRVWDGVGDSAAVGTYATVAGWGTLFDGSQTASSVLMKVAVPVQTNVKCAAQYGTDVITPDMLCAGLDAGGKDSCTGDSGGPLFLRDSTIKNGYLQIALVSFGMGCGQANAYGVYTRISSFVGWICSVSGVCPVVVTNPPTKFPTPIFTPVTPAPTPRTPAPTPRTPEPTQPIRTPAPTRGAVVPNPPLSTPPTPFPTPLPTPNSAIPYTPGKGKNKPCRTCVWCFSSLPVCAPATQPITTPQTPAPTTQQPTQQPTPGKAKAAQPNIPNNNNNNGFGGLFGGNGDLSNILGLQLLLNGGIQRGNRQYGDNDNQGNNNGQANNDPWGQQTQWGQQNQWGQPTTPTYGQGQNNNGPAQSQQYLPAPQPWSTQQYAPPSQPQYAPASQPQYAPASQPWSTTPQYLPSSQPQQYLPASQPQQYLPSSQPWSSAYPQSSGGLLGGVLG